MDKKWQYYILYDNLCLLCDRSQRFITALDWLNRIKTVPLYDTSLLASSGLPVPPQANLVKELHLICSNKKILTGFYACRKIALLLPLTSLFGLLLYLPMMNVLGEIVYRHIVRVRK